MVRSSDCHLQVCTRRERARWEGGSNSSVYYNRWFAIGECTLGTLNWRDVDRYTLDFRNLCSSSFTLWARTLNLRTRDFHRIPGSRLQPFTIWTILGPDRNLILFCLFLRLSIHLGVSCVSSLASPGSNDNHPPGLFPRAYGYSQLPTW